MTEEQLVAATEQSEIQTEEQSPSGGKVPFELPTNCQADWLPKFFKAIRDFNPSEINRVFITANVVGNKHEGSILRISQFLGLSDKQGGRGENYEKLRFFGDDAFKKNLSEIIRTKYSKVFRITQLSSVKMDGLTRVVMSEYSVGQIPANRAISVLLNLATLSDLEISEDLSRSPLKNTAIKERKEPPKSQKTSQTSEHERTSKSERPLTHYENPQRVEEQADFDDRSLLGNAQALIISRFGRLKIQDEETLAIARSYLAYIENKLKEEKTKTQVAQDVVAGKLA
jgi:hypothetical protein